MVKLNHPGWDLNAIKNAVIDAEAKTSGEIVPVIVESSGDYSSYRYLISLLFVAIGSAAAWLLSDRFPWVVDLSHLLLVQLMLAALGWLVGALAPVTRLLAGKLHLAENAHSAALAAFLRHGLGETRDRTGVLIYVSLLEHRVEILGDRGIHEKVGEGFWNGEVAKLVAGIRAGRPAEATAEVIREIGEKLAHYFPKRGDDTNELDDHLRTR